MDISVSLTCAAGTNVFYIPVTKRCLVRDVRYTANADPGADKKVGLDVGSTNIVDPNNTSNDLYATPGQIRRAIMEAGADSAVATPTNPIKATVVVSNAVEVGMSLVLDEFEIK